MRRPLCLGIVLSFGVALCAAPKAEEEALAALEAWRQATQTKDAAALAKLLHPDLSYSHSDGKTQTRADILAELPTSPPREIVVHDPKVRVYGDTALIKADVDFINRTGAEPSVARLNVLHVFLRTTSGWQLTARQSTRINR